ncbi:MAG: DUF721 domain-containing protein [Lentisphaeria bacterium]|nr:DUF721 domain-containing protein [Lentisphaeria bacterium]
MDDGEIDPLQKAAFFRRLKHRNLLAEWYGPAYASREITAYGSKARPLEDFLGDVTKQVFSAETDMQMRLAENWPSVVGPGLCAMCTPGTLEQGVLTLEVRHSAYRKELENAFELILALSNRYLGNNVCREIRLAAANRRRGRFSKTTTSK